MGVTYLCYPGLDQGTVSGRRLVERGIICGINSGDCVLYKKNRKESEWVLTIWEGRGTGNGGRNGTGSIGSVEWDGCLGGSGDDERGEGYGGRICGWNVDRKGGRITERGVGCGAAERGGGGGGDGGDRGGGGDDGRCRCDGGLTGAWMQLGVACDDESNKDQGEHDAREQEKKRQVD